MLFSKDLANQSLAVIQAFNFIKPLINWVWLFANMAIPDGLPAKLEHLPGRHIWWSTSLILIQSNWLMQAVCILSVHKPSFSATVPVLQSACQIGRPCYPTDSVAAFVHRKGHWLWRLIILAVWQTSRHTIPGQKHATKLIIYIKNYRARQTNLLSVAHVWYHSQ